MNDAQSTVAGLKLQDCPGGEWNGMPAEIERATVADCLAHGVCGCIYGDAVQHIERLRADFDRGAEGMRHAILGLLPGGQTCDPQWLADAIRSIGIPRADEQPAPRSVTPEEDARLREAIRDSSEHVHDIEQKADGKP